MQCFNCKNVSIEHNKDCLLINGKQNVKLENGFISFKNYSKQIPAPFKIYADFECILKNVDSSFNNNDTSYTKNIWIMFLVVLLIRLCVLIIDLAKRLFCTEGKMQLINLSNQF